MRSLGTFVASAVASALVSGLTSAQAINIDLEDINANQGAASGPGAAQQPGTWNVLGYTPTGIPTTALFDTSGSPTGASASSTGSGLSPNLPNPCASWGAGEVGLYDGVQSSSGMTFTVTGLAPDTYSVYVLAKTDLAGPTAVSVTGSGVVSTILGTCPPAPQVHGNPESYIVQTVTIAAGASLFVNVTSTPSFSTYSLCGIQIEPSSGPIGTNYCTSTVNSTGFPAVISAVGTKSMGMASIAANDLMLTAGPAKYQPGMFFYGPGQIQVPLDNGFLCVGGGQARMSVNLSQDPDGDGLYTFTDFVDYANPPSAQYQITPGSTWNFQCWFRDPAAGGQFANLSDGVEISFTN